MSAPIFLLKFLRGQLLRKLPVPTDSYAGKVVIVTGSNGGLGLEASKHFARLGAETLILAVRNLAKGEAAKKDIVVATGCKASVIQVWQLDMASYESVKQFAARVARDLPRVDALVENAGILTKTFTMAEDNESTITVNVLSTFLLAVLMLPKLKETARQHGVYTNLVIVSSSLHYITPFPERNPPANTTILATLSDPATARMADRYNVSKLLTIFCTRALASQTAADTHVTINAVCPGFCKSQLAHEAAGLGLSVGTALFARETEEGSRALVHAAGAAAETHGQYLSDCRVGEVAPLVSSEEGAQVQRAAWAEILAKVEAVAPGARVAAGL